MSDLSHILNSIKSDDPQAMERLLPLVYDELRRLAAAKLAREQPGQTLQASALVHEVWLKFAQSETPQVWENRRHFLAAAAEAMRRILVDHARRKQRIKHGGQREGRREEMDLYQLELPGGQAPDEVLRIHEVIDRLAAEDEISAALAKLCYFGGLDLQEAAELTGVSRATAYRHWAFAKAWLHREIRKDSREQED